MNKGEIAWQVPNGDTPPNAKDALTKLGLTNVPPTGFPSQASFVVTKTLLIGGEGSGDVRCSMPTTRRPARTSRRFRCPAVRPACR